LSGKFEAQAFEEEIQLGLRLGVAREQKFASISDLRLCRLNAATASN
jgi:hypothetical protein